MEMDWNLKKLASFFKFFLWIVEKSLKTDYSCSSSEKSLIFSSRCTNSNFMLEKRFFVKYFSSLDQTIAESPGSAL